MKTERASKTYRYRTPAMRDWATVICLNLKEAREIVRMEVNQFSSDAAKLPRGTIIERAPSR